MTIFDVMAAKPCGVHHKAKFEACWTIRQDKGGRLSLAVCNRRARAAGATGKIDSNSLRKNFSKKGK